MVFGCDFPIVERQPTWLVPAAAQPDNLRNHSPDCDRRFHREWRPARDFFGKTCADWPVHPVLSSLSTQRNFPGPACVEPNAKAGCRIQGVHETIHPFVEPPGVRIKPAQVVKHPGLTPW